MRVLVLADVCNPEWPSLPIVGYKYARSLANEVEATVVTQVRNKPQLDKAGFGRAEVVYLDTEKVAAPIYKAAVFLRRGNTTGWTTQMAMDYPSYLAFEAVAWRRFRRDLQGGRFDLVHRITPMSPALPSYMASRCPVPFLVGPLNGNLPWPSGFTAELRREREWLSYLRNAYKVLPYHRSTYADSAAILAAFDHTIKDLPARHADKIINFPEVGIDPELFSLPVRPKRERMTVLYAGRLVPYKLPEVAVRAFAHNPALRKHRLVVAGDGPERPRLEALVKEHNLSDCVQLLGQRPQAEVGALMREAEIFAFPSIRELGAGVVVEAMACGMACVVVDYGGPATLIGPDRGIKVPVADKEALTARFADEIAGLLADPERTARLGRAAHEHAMALYPWDKKAQKTREIYDWVLSKGGPKPDFFRPVGPPARAAAVPLRAAPPEA
jgi:glycosyltransferase involved in cell wall biosynthesis